MVDAKTDCGAFDVSVPTVNEHLKNIFESDELEENSVIRNFRITATDGKEYDTKHYNLDTILAVGYRVKSDRGNAVSQMGNRKTAGISGQGFYLRRRTAQAGRRPCALFSRATSASAGYPK